MKNMRKYTEDDVEIIRASNLFDADWYLKSYPDVKALGMDPAEHYLWLGAKLGRNPSPRFNTVAYLSLNADVETADVNPLLHYMKWGRKELREIALTDKVYSTTNGLQHRLKIAVLAWDVGHNPVGRAYLIAEALSKHFEVILIGPQFPRFGQKVWQPIQNGRLPVISYPGRLYPYFDNDADTIAERLDCDAIVACKPRMPSLQLALLAKHKFNRPIILDIDDHELAFCSEFTPLQLHELQNGTHSDLHEPYSSTWTRFAETLIPYADAVLTSNEALRDRFGGTIIPHARDESLFDPNNYNRDNCRERLGVEPHDKVVLFAGTARAHKGLVELATALGTLARPEYKLCVVGDIQDRGLKSRVASAGAGRVFFFPNQPLNELPRFLRAADLVCLLQDQNNPISHFQLPAKLIDALAMGIPVLSTETRPIRPFVEKGIVLPLTMETLASKLDAALRNSDTLRQQQQANRALFLSEYSYRAIGRKLESIILSCLKNPKVIPERALHFRKIQQSIPGPSKEHAIASPRKINPCGRYDLVMFWKQNDTGVYGRRSDMLAKYLARHKDIRQVLMIDAPLWHGELLKKAAADGPNEHRIVYKEITMRSLGLRDRENLSFHSFIYYPASRHPLARWQYATKQDYLDWLQKLFTEYDVSPQRSIFWLFPVNQSLGDVVRKFAPKLVVSDVVDDQRAQPGLSDERKQIYEENYRELLALSDLVVTNCKPVQESMGNFGPPIRLLPNACEIEEPVQLPDHELQRLLDIPQPRLGYVGNLESKIDVSLIEYIATSRPDWHIVLIGSTHTRSEVLKLNRFHNVHLMGVVSYDEARVWMRHFDVAIMPHLETPLTKSMNPLKLFVYLAQHVPVVSTPVPNIDELGHLIYISHSKEDFLHGIAQVLSQRTAMPFGMLDEELRAHSWPERIHEVMKWIEAIDRPVNADQISLADKSNHRQEAVPL